MLIINSPHAYKYIEIDTQEYDKYEKVSDQEKARMIKNDIEEKLLAEEEENKIYRNT